MRKKDYYDALGIKKDASSSQIKSAYRKLAKKYHPDTNPGDHQVEQLFKEVTEAYNVLSDKEKRRLYDKFGHAAFDGSMGEDPEAFAKAREEAKARYEGYVRGDPFSESSGTSDIFGEEAFNDGSYHRYYYNGNADSFFGDMFGDFFHHKQDSRDRYGQRNSFGRQETWDAYNDHGSDISSELTISFADAALGCAKRIRLDDDSSEFLEVKIPAGIDEGQSVRLKGKGRSGSAGRRGDLFIKIHIEEDKKYTRKGLDVFFDGKVPYTTAILGGEVRFDTLYGPVACKIPAGSQAGSKLRLRGKGIVSMKDGCSYGDAFVTLQIQVPKHVSPKERELLLQLREAEKEKTIM